MCYSALVQQDLQRLARRYGAAIAWDAFAALFRQRLEDPDIQVSRALDVHVLQTAEAAARPSQGYIEAYRAMQARKWEQELFKQRTRVADRQRELAVKETKTGRKDLGIAENKVSALSAKLKTLRKLDLDAKDPRIYPRWYAPVIVNDGGQRVIRPMRYQCRIAGKPAFYDKRYPGSYNARRDSLSGFWSQLYARQHAVLLVDSFFENVPLHVYEKRELAPGEGERNVVLHFNPNTGTPMIIACLWSHWTGHGEPSLDSFAAITDEPPQEILETGHNRCIISIREENVTDWLAPAGLPAARLEAILNDKVTPIYKHAVEQAA